jgi:hypothetical protein
LIVGFPQLNTKEGTMKRIHTLVLILALMFAFTASAFAQDRACGDLSAEDCDILYGSAEAMKGVTSGSQFVGVEFSATNVPQTPYTDLSFDWSLDTTYDYSDDAAAAAMSVQEMSPEEIAALYADPAALSDLVTTILAGTSASLDMNSSFSDELASVLGMSTGGQWPGSVALSAVLDAGTAYVDMSTLAPLLGQGGMSGWLGVDFLPLVEASLMQSATDPSAAMAASVSTQAGAGPLFTQLAGADPTGTITQFLNIERAEGGDNVASFVTTVDWDAFVASPYFEQLIMMALMQSSGGAMPAAADVEQAVALGRMFGPALLQGITLELVEDVALDTGYLESTEFTFDWDLTDLAAIAQMAGGAAMEIGENAAIMLSVVTENSNLNGDVTIEVPSDAMMIPAEALMGSTGGQ